MDLLKERPRCRLLDAALRLIADTIGIQGHAGIDGRPHLHQAGSTVLRHVHLSDLRDVRAVIDRRRDAQTATLTRRAAPTRALRDVLGDAPKPRILDVRETEGERILPRGVRELVDERLDGEDVLRSRERAEGRGAQRRRFDVQRDARLGKPVMRLGVAARRLRPPTRIEAAAGMHIGVLVVAPRADAPVRVKSSSDLEVRGRARRRERELLDSRPLQQHRPARVLRQDRCLVRRVAARVAPVCAAGHLRQDAHALLVKAERFRDRLAQPERPLRAGVDHRAVRTHVCDRGARTDRRVRDRREDVLRLEPRRRSRDRLVDALVIPYRDVPTLFVRRRRLTPLDLDRIRCGASLILSLGDDADQPALTHDRNDSRHRTRRRVIDAPHRRVAHGRPNDRAVRHTRDADVRDESRLAGDDVPRLEPRHRLSDVAALRVRPQANVSRDRALDRLSPRPQLARVRRGAAEKRRFLRDRAAPERAHVVRHVVRVAENDAHLFDGDVEFVGHELRERRAYPLTELDLAGERDDRTVRLDADPLFNALGLALAPGHVRLRSVA